MWGETSGFHPEWGKAVMKKKAIVWAGAAALILSLLAGCAGRQDSGPSAGTSTGTAGGSAAQSAAPQGREKAEIKIIGIGVEIAEQQKAMVEDYMREHPHVTVQLDLPHDDTLLKTRFASGEGPDIFVVPGYNGIANWLEYLADLSNEPWMSKVAPLAVPGMTVDGKKYGFPTAVVGYGFIYNKQLFAKAGIEKVPSTLTELREANEKLKAAGIQSYAEPYKEWWPLGQHLFSLPFAYEEDMKASIDKINRGEMEVKDLAKIQGFFDVLDMTVEYGKGKESVGVAYNDQLMAFAAGEVAMIQHGPWVYDPIIKINPDIEMDVFAIPLSDDPSETRMPVDVPTYYVVNKNSKYLDEAKKFLTWFHENGQKYIVGSYRYIPGFTDLEATPELGPIAEGVFRYQKENKTIPWAYTLWPAGSSQEFVKPLQSYVAGMIDRDAALDEIQKIWNIYAQR